MVIIEINTLSSCASGYNAGSSDFHQAGGSIISLLCSAGNFCFQREPCGKSQVLDFDLVPFFHFPIFTSIFFWQFDLFSPLLQGQLWMRFFHSVLEHNQACTRRRPFCLRVQPFFLPLASSLSRCRFSHYWLHQTRPLHFMLVRRIALHATTPKKEENLKEAMCVRVVFHAHNKPETVEMIYLT